jgi:hypothetical protein
MTPAQRGSIFASLIGIVVCGTLGGTTAWALVQFLGADGTPGAILAAVIGMTTAFAAWAGGVALLRALGWIR